MTREEIDEVCEFIDEFINHDYRTDADYELINIIIEGLKHLLNESEVKITREEKEIREELNKLTTYRVPNSSTDLVSLKAVERILNLVFRGYRDKESEV